MEDKHSSSLFKQRRKKPKQVCINCNISDIRTAKACAKVLTEITKYIVCQKLIPYPYEVLKYAAQEVKKLSVEVPEKRKTLQLKRHYRKMVEAYENFEVIFQHVELELQNSEDRIEEMVLLMGATTRSPKETYSIMIPPVSFKNQHLKEEGNRILLNLIRSVVLSEDFNDMLTEPLSPTNMYVLVKKREGKQSEWFIPKDCYSLPQCGHRAIINLTNPVPSEENYEDANLSMSADGSAKLEGCCTAQPDPALQVDEHLSQKPLSTLMDNLSIAEGSTHWFQAPLCVKGFRYSKNNGLSGISII